MIGIEFMLMPTSCRECRFFDNNGDYPTCLVLCRSKGYNFPVSNSRFPECPLIELVEKTPEYCNCKHNLKRGDTIYDFSEDDIGMMFNKTQDIQYCPVCGRILKPF